MTGPELRDTLIREIVKTYGGSGARWRQAVGQIKVYSRATHAHCNWDVRATGSPRQIEIVESAVDAMRTTLPFVEES
ncbi:hypothetical protein [Sphingomonas abietis]|uniref:Uncharacterized protein n=1 Tax=Sphingomonas abietis TaxID=3012344 RepID=A0ABY7NH27_9SPHN|nr:hypothetical protein [Sphingomonas abietis]WBO20794.1 hypothetical protein PBT88_11270 [Sphingomonas abietis]